MLCTYHRSQVAALHLWDRSCRQQLLEVGLRQQAETMAGTYTAWRSEKQGVGAWQQRAVCGILILRLHWSLVFHTQLHIFMFPLSVLPIYVFHFPEMASACYVAWANTSHHCKKGVASLMHGLRTCRQLRPTSDDMMTCACLTGAFYL